MAEPLTQLAMALHHQPGVYAILLGSGVSTAAGIPTGWKVTLELVKKLARAQGESAGVADPEGWYKGKYSGEPNYSKVVKMLAPSISERQALLKGYFEPTGNDGLANPRVPTRAHTAVARLMKQGYIRVALTTNFDRLLETALANEGVQPVVIANPSDIPGAPALSHAQNLVVKLHGDYLDARIRNTEDELSKYPAAQRQFLERIFDEFGLVVVGWSADYDHALRDAIRMVKGRRHSTYWAAYQGVVTPAADALLKLRGGIRVSINGADEFLEGLENRVRTIREADLPDHDDRAVLRRLLKHYLPLSEHRIRLTDLVHDVSRRAIAGLNKNMPLTVSLSSQEIAARLMAYENRLDAAIEVISQGCRWGTKDQAERWSELLRDVGSDTESTSGGYVSLIELRKYPALVLYYSGALAAVSARRWDNLRSLTETVLDYWSEKHVPVPQATYPYGPFHETFQALPGMERHRTPVSDHLYNYFHKRLDHLVVRKDDFEDLFDRAEFLLALVGADTKSQGGHGFAFVGRFVWRGGHWSGGRTTQLVEAVQKHTAPELLGAGLFGGDPGRLKNAIDEVVQVASRIASRF